MKLQLLYFKKSLNNEQGTAVVIALIMLCVLTIIGVAAIDTSTVETIIAGVEKERQGSFYAAEAGIEHVKGMLTSLFVSRNAAKMAGGGDPDWDFALDGSESGISTAAGANYTGGTDWITNGDGGSGYTYTVRIWNNTDNGSATSATNDRDAKIYARSTSTGPQGGTASVEVVLTGTVSGGGSITGYSAQAGAGAAKSFTSDDLNAISSTDLQTVQL